ncbi:MAG: phycobiliprotein lyase [Oscillatoriaceae bacterium SKW80]|nr:phycobiliprotein lyase [Oscillatoriaceae bacterium SKYG93]MCX8122368.1 phycobiliprotein lyase [Oscillatoriaceae bacterium SKW80]MDW8452476.1 phycobiliprotein lyase [Oscillatoriaceae cyanobacterium SKYGB_i_bin93]HIK27755.1 phycobiliprotein lyase [Oscillatoriaceae cyanobacterium M7585_C2015_266]
MNINEFFKQSAGKWFSQRTSHYLNSPQLEVGKTDLWIEILSPEEPEVIQLCQKYSVEPMVSPISVRVKWDGIVGVEQKRQVGSTILVAIADKQAPQTGSLIQRANNQKTLTGHYILNNDGALTLTVGDDTIQAEERIWFESPNLRLRTSNIKTIDGTSITSFCSEIRMGITQTAAKAPSTQTV